MQSRGHELDELGAMYALEDCDLIGSRCQDRTTCPSRSRGFAHFDFGPQRLKIEGGVSCSPILNADGGAIGLISTGDEEFNLHPSLSDCFRLAAPRVSSLRRLRSFLKKNQPWLTAARGARSRSQPGLRSGALCERKTDICPNERHPCPNGKATV